TRQAILNFVSDGHGSHGSSQMIAVASPSNRSGDTGRAIQAFVPGLGISIIIAPVRITRYESDVQAGTVIQKDLALAACLLHQLFKLFYRHTIASYRFL
ncbi:MAG: hypothetical protein MJ061_01130, partial [Mailhella sp.]|nr:hypothetical protein [Mailhella sp.]